MKYLNLSFPLPEENLACDEALLELCENGESEILRFWESPEYIVVLGYANKARAEVNRAACGRENIPILRRPSGGGTVLLGPGCLNYSLVLHIRDANLRNITSTNRFVLERMRNALEPLLGPGIEIRGDTDLSLHARKFSGNAQRRKRNSILFHGTLLLRFDLGLIEKVIRTPKKQPPYRVNRGHRDFLMNLNLPASLVRQSIKTEWGAKQLFANTPHTQIRELAAQKYASRKWNLKF
jgi:lipoate-protein ligase A